MIKNIDNYVLKLNVNYENKLIFLNDMILNNDDVLNKMLVHHKYNDIYNYCIYNAVLLDSYELVKIFLKINFTHSYNDIMIIACKNQNLNILKLLVENNFYKCGNCLSNINNPDILTYLFDNNFPCMENETETILDNLFNNIINNKKYNMIDIVINKFASYKNKFIKKILIEAMKLNNEELIVLIIQNDKYCIFNNNSSSQNFNNKNITDIFYNNHDLFTLEELAYCNYFDLYKYKLDLLKNNINKSNLLKNNLDLLKNNINKKDNVKCNNQCGVDCKCLDYCVNNHSFVSYILDNNVCLYSSNFVLKIIKNKNIFDKIISKINRFNKNENIVSLIENIDQNNIDQNDNSNISLFIKTAMKHFNFIVYLEDKHVNIILKTNETSLIETILFDKNINISNKNLYITNEKYEIYELFFYNQYHGYLLHNNNANNDFIDIKAYEENNVDLLQYCISNKCSKNNELINIAIKNNDIEILKLLYNNNYKFNIDTVDIKLIKTHEIFMFLLTKIRNITAKNYVKIYLTSDVFCENNELQNKIISSDLLNKKNMKGRYNKIIDDDFIVYFTLKKMHDFVCYLLKNQLKN